MSAHQPLAQTLAQIQALAVQAQTDPEASDLFEKQLRITATDFSELTGPQQQLHIDLLKVGTQLEGFYTGHPVPAGAPLDQHEWLLNPHTSNTEYVRYLGGRDTPFVTYDLSVHQADDGRWVPMHGSVSMPSQETPEAAANMVMNYWLERPLEDRITNDQYQSIKNNGVLYGVFPRLEEMQADRSAEPKAKKAPRPLEPKADAELVQKVLEQLNAYSKKPMSRIEGDGYVVASQPKKNRAIAVIDGDFGRAEYKAVHAEIAERGLEPDVIYVVADTATYTGAGIDFKKFDELGIDRTPKAIQAAPVAQPLALACCLHVTSADALEAIIKEGLQPRKGAMSERVEAKPAVFMFPSWEDMDDANWLFEEWPHEGEPVLLAVNTSGIELRSEVGYEVFSEQLIAADRLTVIAPSEKDWAYAKQAFLKMGGAEHALGADQQSTAEAPTLSQLTRAYVERLHKAIEQAAPLVMKAWTSKTKQSRVQAALAEPLTDTREQAVNFTFVVQDMWVHVYEPDGKYPTPERKALVDEFRSLLGGEFFEQVYPQAVKAEQAQKAQVAVEQEQRTIDPLDERDYFPGM